MDRMIGFGPVDPGSSPGEPLIFFILLITFNRIILMAFRDSTPLVDLSTVAIRDNPELRLKFN